MPLAALCRARKRYMLRPEREPRLVEPESAIEIGQGVQLHRLIGPFPLDARAQLAREPGWLPDVTIDDV